MDSNGYYCSPSLLTTQAPNSNDSSPTLPPLPRKDPAPSDSEDSSIDPMEVLGPVGANSRHRDPIPPSFTVSPRAPLSISSFPASPRHPESVLPLPIFGPEGRRANRSSLDTSAETATERASFRNLRGSASHGHLRPSEKSWSPDANGISDRDLAMSAIPHLPVLSPGSNEPTALTNWDVANELEFTISKIAGEDALKNLLRDKSAMREFRHYVETSFPDATPELIDFYHDLRVFSDLTSSVRLACHSIESVYLSKDSPLRLQLPITIRGPVLECLRLSSSVGLSMTGPQKELLGSLYKKEFQAFVQKKLIDQAVQRLGTSQMGLKDRNGLGDCYCLTNPRLRDHPIVLASEGFAQLTGYIIETIVGRNCRFLQGPGTAPESVARLRAALNNGESITSLLLNYRRNGEPFFNLLCMLPLKGPNGEVKYFLGGQIDVTGNLSSLLGDDFSPDAEKGTLRLPRSQFTPAVQAQAEIHTKKAKRTASTAASTSKRLPRQASISSLTSGSVDGGPASTIGNGTGSIKFPTKSWGKSRKSHLGLTKEEHEAMNVSDPQSLESNISKFEATYSRVLLVQQESRQILFATEQLAEFCGLPKSSAHTFTGVDFPKLIHGETKEDTRRLRHNIKLAIQKGHAYSVGAFLMPQKSSLFGKKPSEEELQGRACMLHLTPLSDKNGHIEAFVVMSVTLNFAQNRR